MKNKKDPKIALVHEYLIQYGGAEKTLEMFMEMFPKAPIYTGLADVRKFPSAFDKVKIHSIKNPWVIKFHKFFTFLMPLVFESFDLSEYDIIVSDGHAWPKSVLTKPHQLHISYVHSPPRFLYGYSVESQKRDKWYFKPFVALIDFTLKIWDFNAAQRPDFLVTNSKETKKRISRFYSREATVIYPPVNVDADAPTKAKTKRQQAQPKAPYFLALGRLTAYKNFDFLVKAFNKSGKSLVIAGTGPEEQKLNSAANKNIRLIGRVSETEKHELLKNCLGLINLVEDEDFGIVPIEAMAHGKPVLAHKSGGHLETIIEGKNGRFFEAFDTNEFNEQVKIFEQEILDQKYKQQTIKNGVQHFNNKRFKQEFYEFVMKKWEQLESINK